MKCDETHPTCERCTKAKIPCEGYARDLKFVDEKGRAQKRVQIKRQAYLEAVQAEEKQLKAVRKSKTPQPTNRPMGSIGHVLSLVNFKDKVQLSFTLNRLFDGWRLFVPWIMRGYKGTEDCTTTQTVKALSAAYFGRMHNDRATFESGMIPYSNALRLLGSDLKDPNTAFETPAVTNVLALVMFEVCSSEILSKYPTNQLLDDGMFQGRDDTTLRRGTETYTSPRTRATSEPARLGHLREC